MFCITSKKKVYTDLYYFKNKDKIYAEIEFYMSFFRIKKVYVDTSNCVLFMLKDDESFNKWISDRQTLLSRKNAVDLFKISDIRNNKDFVDVSLCLSLKDTFWLTPDKSLKWSSVSLFSNSFNSVYQSIALTGRGYNGVSLKTPSPELSVLGSSLKGFKRYDGSIYMLKSFGGLNELEYSGVYSEYFVSQLEKELGLKNYVDYSIVKYKDILCSKSKLFTSESIGVIDIEDLCDDSMYLEEHIKRYSGVALKDYMDMMIVDSLVLNVDRHCENIALLYDTETLRLIGLAPFYDFDHSLCYDLSLEHRSDSYILDGLAKYVPKTYCNHTFLNQALYCMYDDMREKLIKLYKCNFSFKNHSKYPISEERLEVLNRILRRNIAQILRGY